MAGDIQTIVTAEVVKSTLAPDALATIVDSQAVTYTVLGVQGPPGADGEGANETFVHVQDAPAAVWSVQHDLGRWPSVTIVDSAGNNVFGAVKYHSEDLVEISFSAAFSGRAYLN